MSRKENKEKGSLQPVTELMIHECPYLKNLLAIRIFAKLSVDSFENADWVVDLDKDMPTLAYYVTRLINKYRRLYSKKPKLCREINQTILREDHVSFWQLSQLFFSPKKKIVFVHCLFDEPGDPENYYSNFLWGNIEEAQKSFWASEQTKNPDYARKLAESFGGTLCQSIVLPVPREDYIRIKKKIILRFQRIDEQYLRHV